jgi:hypothetical protein
MKSIKNLNAANIGEEAQVPSATPIFVSLYIILLAFFVVMTKDSDLKSSKAEIALNSIYEKFGNSEKEFVAVSDIAKPKVADYAKQIELLLKDVAIIESSLNGEDTTIIFDKSAIFYADETNLKPGRNLPFEKLIEIVKKWQREQKISLQIIVSLENFELDKQRLDFLVQSFANNSIKIGFNRGTKDKINLNIKVEK